MQLSTLASAWESTRCFETCKETKQKEDENYDFFEKVPKGWLRFWEMQSKNEPVGMHITQGRKSSLKDWTWLYKRVTPSVSLSGKSRPDPGWLHAQILSVSQPPNTMLSADRTGHAVSHLLAATTEVFSHMLHWQWFITWSCFFECIWDTLRMSRKP